MNLLLEAKGLGYGFDGHLLQSGLDFSLNAGEALLVSGPNGCGKSTLLNVIRKKLAPLAGSLRLHVSEGEVHTIAQMENLSLHAPLTLGDVAEIHEVDTDGVLELGLLSRQHLKIGWNVASGGERKRMLLSICLIRKPSLILMDEPANHLDPESRQRLLVATARYLKQANKPVALVLISHHGLNSEEAKWFNLKQMRLEARA